MSNSVSGPIFSTSALDFCEEMFTASEEGKRLTGIPPPSMYLNLRKIISFYLPYVLVNNHNFMRIRSSYIS